MTAVILRRRLLGRTSCREIAKRSQEGIVAVRNDKLCPPDTDLVFRWGCTSNTLCKNVVNTAKSIHQVSDKAGFRKLIKGLCTETWDDWDDVPNAKLEMGVIIRPRTHSRGRKLWEAGDRGTLVDACEAAGEGYYINQFIHKVAEYRVFVVQGRVVCVAQKTPGNPDDVAWNVAQGGRFDNVRWDDWPLKAVKVSVEAFNLSELDFGGVDVMVDGGGAAYVIEINSAPSLTSDYRQQCFAKAFDYIVKYCKAKRERIPLVEGKGGYTKFIHPAVCDRAKMKGK